MTSASAPDAPIPDAAAPAAGGAAPEDDALALAHAMFDACRSGNGDGVLPYLDAGAPATMRDAEGNSLLMLAAYHGHAGLVGALIERGADVDQVNDRGQSPLAGAVFKGFDEVARVLIEAGADADAGTPSARETAVFFGREQIAALLDDSAPQG